MGAYAWMTVTLACHVSKCAVMILSFTGFQPKNALAVMSCKSIPTPLFRKFWFPEKRIVVSPLVVLPFPVHLISEIPRMSIL